MRLTEKKAIAISKELWTDLAETGEEYKGKWDGWKKYGEMESDCALCEYDDRHTNSMCSKCPYFKKFGICDNDGTLYTEWRDAKTSKARKKYAQLFLEQLKEL